MPQEAKKNDQPDPAENNLQPSIEKWLPDTFLKFKQPHSNFVCTKPADFLLAEHLGQDMFFTIIHHEKMIKVAMRMSYKEFWQHMPDGLMEELIRGVAVQVKRITEIHPESTELEFDHKYTVKIEHVVDPDTLKHFGDSKASVSDSSEVFPPSS